MTAARSWLPALGYVLLATAALMAGAVAAAPGRLGLLVLLLAMAGLLGLAVLLMPLRLMPAAALLSQVLIPVPPVSFLLQPGIPTLGAGIMMVWGARSLYERRQELADRRLWGSLLPVALLSAWLMVGVLLSFSPTVSFGWTYAFATAVLVPAVVPMDASTKRTLVRAWIGVGVFLSIHVAIEVVLGNAFLYGAVYDALGVPSQQHWSSYRPEASFRHPLPAAAFLAASGVLSLGEGVRRQRTVYAGFAVLMAGAAVATLSRGAIIGLVAGSVVAIALWSHRRYPRSAPWRYPLLLSGLGLLLAGLTYGPVAERLNSAEAGRSGEARLGIVPIVLKAVGDHPILGGGPGTSQFLVAPYNPQAKPIESSFFQLWISAGAIGLALFLGVCAWAVWRGIRSGDVGAAGALTCFVATLALFNALESRLTLLLYLGLLIGLARSTPEPASPDDTSPEPDVVRRPRSRGAGGSRPHAGPRAARSHRGYASATLGRHALPAPLAPELSRGPADPSGSGRIHS